MMIDTLLRLKNAVMFKRLLFIVSVFLFCLFPFHSQAQENDHGTWLSVDISKEITKKLDLEFEEEVRIFKDFSEINRFGTSLGGSYSVNKQLKGGVGYTWLYRHDINDNFWENRHRYYAYATGKAELGRFTFALREKFQSTYYDTSLKGNDYSPVNYLRSRLEVDWDVRGFKPEPYASAEMHYQLNNPDGNEIDDWRYTLGINFPLSKKMDLDAYLRLDQEVNVKKPVNLYLIGINLKFNL